MEDISTQIKYQIGATERENGSKSSRADLTERARNKNKVNDGYSRREDAKPKEEEKSRDQRTIRRTTACRGRGWQARGRGELAENRGQFDVLRHAEGEDGRQEEEEN